jgi:hypothetical protein
MGSSPHGTGSRGIGGDGVDGGLGIERPGEAGCRNDADGAEIPTPHPSGIASHQQSFAILRERPLSREFSTPGRKEFVDRGVTTLL